MENATQYQERAQVTESKTSLARKVKDKRQQKIAQNSRKNV